MIDRKHLVFLPDSSCVVLLATGLKYESPFSCHHRARHTGALTTPTAVAVLPRMAIVVYACVGHLRHVLLGAATVKQGSSPFRSSPY